MEGTISDAGTGQAQGGPEPTAVGEQLDRILASESFPKSGRRPQFLRFVVEEALAGRADRLKGVAIAIAVFGRDETFDQQNDPVVRLEARRMRRDLDGYYATVGRNDPVRISIPKGGYVPSFHWLNAPQSPAAPAADPVTPEVGQAAAERRPAPPRRWPWLAVGAGVLALAIVGARHLPGLLPDQRVRFTTPDDPALVMPRGPSIAVLPFLNLSGEPDRQYFSDGVTEQLATELGRFRHLRVLWLGTMERDEDALSDPRRLRGALGAHFVLEGSVRAADDTVRITARLIDTRDARQIWVQSFEAPLDPGRIYSVQDTIAQEVAGRVAGKYGILAHGAMAQTKRHPPESLDVYDCVLRYYDYQITINPQRHAEVKACLERAVKLEPEFAEAWAVLANVYMQEKRFGIGRPGAADAQVAQARAFAERAIAIDPAEPTGHLVLSNLLFTEGDIAGFKEAGEKAIRLNPNDADLLAHYGTRLAVMGEWERGLSLIDKATTINPLHPQWYGFAEAIYRYDRREYALAAAQLAKIDMPRFLWSHLLRAATWAQLGQAEEAAAASRALLALQPDFENRAINLMRHWQFPERLLHHLVDGLRKAGLAVALPQSNLAKQ
jgi:adenylate cyclase